MQLEQHEIHVGTARVRSEYYVNTGLKEGKGGGQREQRRSRAREVIRDIGCLAHMYRLVRVNDLLRQLRLGVALTGDTRRD